MAATSHRTPTTSETPITIKVVFEGSNRKFKLPLQDLNVHVFPEKIRSILQIPENQEVTLERFSDSGSAYVVLDAANASAYKQLYRAAKAKLKLHIRATIVDDSSSGPAGANKRDQPTPQPPVEPLGARLSSFNPRPEALHTLYSNMAENSAKTVNPASNNEARDAFFDQLAATNAMARKMKAAQLTASSWQIFCNNCDKPIADAHFHCSVCDGGDFDLCEGCVENGKTCSGEGHWLIKRFIKNGKVINSTTEKAAAKDSSEKKKIEREVLGSSKAETKVDAFVTEPSRTCNSCISVLPEASLVTCKDCADFDLCVPCLSTKHGHHPGHAFESIVAGANIDVPAALCAPGNDTRHHANCDGCDETIFGVRHKCVNCPDWDFCNKCIAGAGKAHAGHRFIPIYGAIDVPASPRSLHYGIFCDGPLCTGKPGQSYIKGVRYKCAICHDTDFCANCEAHPNNKHNETHPLIKFKTAVRGASVEVLSTMPGQAHGTRLGDTPNHGATPQQRGTPSATGAATARVQNAFGRAYPAASAHWAHRASSQVMAQENASTATLPPYSPAVVLDTHVGETKVVKAEAARTKSDMVVTAPDAQLDAHYITDSITDGTSVTPTSDFVQVWTLRNSGSCAWPVGCTVTFVGGDRMLRVNSDGSTSAHELAEAQLSSSTTSLINVGEQFNFVAKMRSPARAGKYISYWRLKAPDGIPFGHKLWCDIVVTAVVEAGASGAPAEWQTQLMLLEQQHKKRLMTTRAEQEQWHPMYRQHEKACQQQNATQDAKPIPATKSVQLRDCKWQLDLLEQQNKKRLALTRQQQDAAPMPFSTGATTASSATTESPKKRDEEEVPDRASPDEKMEASAMVFPTLEKESPASSTYQDTTASAAPSVAYSGPVAHQATVENAIEAETETATVATSVKENFEGLESVEFEESDDDGFLTDEEYDILDASDEEVINRGKK